MSHFRRDVWSYAVLLVILFSLASIAARATISYIEPLLPEHESNVAAILIWTLSLGFMLIAGAFGLWAIKFFGEAEGRRRLGHFVDAMDYIRDGILAIDENGSITGSNPAAAHLLEFTPGENATVRDLFPTVSESAISTLLESDEPAELEMDFQRAHDRIRVRLRSQRAGDMVIVMISDITRMDAQRLHGRQMARLQLIGQLARGVAHDLNTILSSICGHASILGRLRPGSSDMTQSIAAIMHSSEQGVSLAGHLLELAQTGSMRPATEIVGEHMRNAVGMLRESLPAGWQIQEEVEELMPPVALTGLQVEQIILNIGLLAADATGKPGVLKISIGKPSSKPFFNVGGNFGAVVLITAGTPEWSAQTLAETQPMNESPRESGVIHSVVLSMLEEAGGTLYSINTPDRNILHRLALPRSTVSPALLSSGDLPEEVLSYVSHWTVLLAKPLRHYDALDKRLRDAGVNVIAVDSITSALARVEEDRNLDALILDKYLLGKESKGLLKAILKLQPAAAVLVLCDDPSSESDGLSSDVVFVQGMADPNKVLKALIEARNLALGRKASRRTAG